jgi:hypothetical protein
LGTHEGEGEGEKEEVEENFIMTGIMICTPHHILAE